MVQCQAQSGSSNEIINKNEETMKQLITDFNSKLSTLESLNSGAPEADRVQNELLQIQKDALDVNNNYLDEITTISNRYR